METLRHKLERWDKAYQRVVVPEVVAPYAESSSLNVQYHGYSQNSKFSTNPKPFVHILTCECGVCCELNWKEQVKERTIWVYEKVLKEEKRKQAKKALKNVCECDDCVQYKQILAILGYDFRVKRWKTLPQQLGEGVTLTATGVKPSGVKTKTVSTQTPRVYPRLARAAPV